MEGWFTQLLTWLGGASAVAIAIFAFFPARVADYMMTRLKSRLDIQLEQVRSELSDASDLRRLKIRKAELLFDRELEAATEFGALLRSLYPRRSAPHEEWSDACQKVVDDFESIDRNLEKYLIKHDPILPKAIRIKLRSCHDDVANGQFIQHEMDGPDGPQATQAELAAADGFLKKMREAESDLFDLVRNETRS